MKEIIGFPGYWVTEDGKVFSDWSCRWGCSSKYRHELKPKVDSNGYLLVGLHKDGECFNKLIHRLVAVTFIPNPNNLSEVNHKDESSRNNHIENLEWCDRKYNINYGTRSERAGESHKKPVIATKNDVSIEFGSAVEASRMLGISSGNIAKCCKGKKGYKTCGGFVFKYKDALS